MPLVVWRWSPAPQVARDERPELQHPSTDGLIADLQPALGQQVFDIPVAQREPEIEILWGRKAANLATTWRPATVLMEPNMSVVELSSCQDAAATRGPGTTLFVSLELSRSTWLMTSLTPGSDKMSKHTVAGGDGAGLLQLLARLRAKVEQHGRGAIRVVCIQEAGFEGFWVHRLLMRHAAESHIVDPASIAVPRRQRRAKTDAIDGETLLRTLLAWKRGEPRVCAMVVPPSPEEEDERRISRERETLIQERIRHTNRIKGLLRAQGVTEVDPRRRDRRKQLETLRTGDGRPLPLHLKAEILRAVERIELLLRQIAEVEAERDRILQALAAAAEPRAPGPLLTRLKGIGQEFAAVLTLEGLFRNFSNRRQVAAYAGLVPTPWKSGRIDHEQGISKAGNPRLRRTMIELAWQWLRHQPGSALSRWFHDRVGRERGRIRKIAIVAVARKLFVALWRYVTQGVVPEGAVLKGT
jgi:transposase